MKPAIIEQKLRPQQTRWIVVQSYPQEWREDIPLINPEEDISYKTKSQLMEEITFPWRARCRRTWYWRSKHRCLQRPKHANTIARNMINKYGMSEDLQNMYFGDENDEVFLGKSYGHSPVSSAKKCRQKIERGGQENNR